MVGKFVGVFPKEKSSMHHTTASERRDYLPRFQINNKDHSTVTVYILPIVGKTVGVRCTSSLVLQPQESAHNVVINRIWVALQQRSDILGIKLQELFLEKRVV